MKIGVCIKQVPAGQNVPMDPNLGVLIRSGAANIMNPYDLFAIEVALRVREAAGGSVAAFTMGPPDAEQVLRLAFAMGVDEGYLLTDECFAGADVFATSFTLAQGITAAGRYDLIVCGQQTTDGDTAQVPFSLAEQLHLPVLGWVKEIEEVGTDRITVLQEMTGTIYRSQVQFPLVIAVNGNTVQPRLPTLRLKLKAAKMPVIILNLASMQEQDPQRYGQRGSPTRVQKISAPAVVSKSCLITTDAEKTAALLAIAVAECGSEVAD